MEKFNMTINAFKLHDTATAPAASDASAPSCDGHG
jgi:hypothetical protein